MKILVVGAALIFGLGLLPGLAAAEVYPVPEEILTPMSLTAPFVPGAAKTHFKRPNNELLIAPLIVDVTASAAAEPLVIKPLKTACLLGPAC